MVKGLDVFAKAFENFSNCYIVIGGTACDIILTDTDMRPRATDDIDILLILEKMTPEFGDAFWGFINEGGYKRGSRKNAENDSLKYVLYSFDTPKAAAYPVKIELLSHHSDLLGDPTKYHLEPIPFENGVSHLSAIMVDDDLYNITISESEVIQGVRVATTTALICLKIKAYRNLLTDKISGKQINTGDIKKHRNDVLKLIATSAFTEEKIVSEAIINDIAWYIENISSMLPSQSLEAALDRSTGDIKAYLEVLSMSFIKEKRL